MKIDYSEIWYTYSTYYSGNTLISLNDFSELVLKTNITECIYSSDEYYKVLQDDRIISKEIDITYNPNMTKGSFSIKEWPQNDFTKEILYQNCINSYFEKKLLNLDGKYIDNSYIRFSAGEIIVDFSDRQKILYPFFTIYTSGIIILEFRAIYNKQYEIDEYINNCIDFSRVEYSKCYTNKQLSLMSKKLSNWKGECSVLNEENGVFKFELFEYFIKGKNKTLTSVANTFFESLIYLFNLVFKKGRFEIGNIGFHKPHVHLLKYSNQKNTANECIESNSNDIRKILLNISKDYKNYMESFELENLRKFNDFARFYNSGITLTVWSKNGFKSETSTFDPNYNHCIYHSEVTDRFLDYINILYEQSFHYIYTCKSYELLLYHQSSYYLLENDFMHLAKYGEIDDMLNYAKKVLKIQDKASNSLNLLNLKKSELEHKKSQQITVFSYVLTIVFGIISVGAFANDLIYPLYGYFKLPKLSNCYGNHILLWFMSLLIIMSIIFIAYKFIIRKRKKI